MKHYMNTILCLLEGGNKYKVVHALPTEGSEFKGLYLLECVDFWCSEDLGDGIECHKECQQLWIASYHADSMKVYK